MRSYRVWPTYANAVQMEWITVIAEDERLTHASASLCCHPRVFFGMSEESDTEFDRLRQERFRGNGGMAAEPDALACGAAAAIMVEGTGLVSAKADSV